MTLLEAAQNVYCAWMGGTIERQSNIFGNRPQGNVSRFQ